MDATNVSSDLRSASSSVGATILHLVNSEENVGCDDGFMFSRSEEWGD